MAHSLEAELGDVARRGDMASEALGADQSEKKSAQKSRFLTLATALATTSAAHASPT